MVDLLPRVHRPNGRLFLAHAAVPFLAVAIAAMTMPASLLAIGCMLRRRSAATIVACAVTALVVSAGTLPEALVLQRRIVCDRCLIGPLPSLPIATIRALAWRVAVICIAIAIKSRAVIALPSPSSTMVTEMALLWPSDTVMAEMALLRASAAIITMLALPGSSTAILANMALP